MTFKDIPAWFWMIMTALLIIPTSYSIFKNGIKAKLKTKIISGEIDADSHPDQVQNDKQD